jgi:hypothetical protein
MAEWPTTLHILLNIFGEILSIHKTEISENFHLASSPNIIGGPCGTEVAQGPGDAGFEKLYA